MLHYMRFGVVFDGGRESAAAFESDLKMVHGRCRGCMFFSLLRLSHEFSSTVCLDLTFDF